MLKIKNYFNRIFHRTEKRYTRINEIRNLTKKVEKQEILIKELSYKLNTLEGGYLFLSFVYELNNPKRNYR